VSAAVTITGADLLVGGEEHAENVKRLMRMLAQRAARARDDLVTFFEFVMREEKTQKPIRVAPHQKVMLEFIMAHDRCVIMLPIDHSKTYVAAALTLWLLGKNTTTRGCIVSATQEQSEKVLKMVRDYIESSVALRAVFPTLRPGMHDGDKWTQTAITVDRPRGIKDPSLVAVGVDGATPGSRLDWVVVDDILNMQNTYTQEQREKTYVWFDNSILSRLDQSGARLIVCNTPWHQDDIPNKLQKAGWATLKMNIMGGVWVQDDQQRTTPAELGGLGLEPWDSEELRPATPNPNDQWCRLVAHDPDPHNEKTLWPERYPLRRWFDPVTKQERGSVEKRKHDHLPHEFARLCMCEAHDDATAMCKREYIELCKLKAREAGVYSFVGTWKRKDALVFTGVDLAVRKGEANDNSAIFTFAVLPGGLRQILNIQFGQWGIDVMDKIFEEQKTYDSIVNVENVGAQDLLVQLSRKINAGAPVKGYTTGMHTKGHPEYGIPALFLEMRNGAWLIPNDRHGRMHPAAEKFVEECLFYVPDAHTGDVLMACTMARELAHEWGVLSGAAATGGLANGASIGMSLMAR
jgi:hypothetical protein